MWMVLPWCNQGDLHSCGRNLVLSERVSVCRQLLESIVELKSKGLVHRDIKSENVLLHRDPFGNLLVRLGDLSFLYDQTQRGAISIRGTPGCLAPEYADLSTKKSKTLSEPERLELEVLKFQRTQSALDVWGCGMICAQLLRPELFLLVQNRGETAEKCIQNRASWFQNKLIPGMDQIDPNGEDPIIQWLKKMLDPSPDTRLGADESLEEFLALERNGFLLRPIQSLERGLKEWELAATLPINRIQEVAQNIWAKLEKRPPASALKGRAIPIDCKGISGWITSDGRVPIVYLSSVYKEGSQRRILREGASKVVALGLKILRSGWVVS